MDKRVASPAFGDWRGRELATSVESRPVGAPRQNPVRIILVSDQRLCRECLRLLIESIDPDLEVVEADCADNIRPVVGMGSKPDIVLYNLVIMDRQGVDFVGELGKSIGDVPLVVMCDKDDPDLMLGCLEKGAKAFLPSTVPGPVLVSALHLVIAGGLYAPPQVLLNFLAAEARVGTGRKGDLRREAAIAENFPMLTPRQQDVLVLLSQGQSNREIAEALEMCENTVKAHVKQVMRKLKADNRTRAALMADRLVR